MQLDLDDEETRALLNLLMETIENDRYSFSPRIQVMKNYRRYWDRATENRLRPLKIQGVCLRTAALSAIVRPVTVGRRARKGASLRRCTVEKC